MQSLYLDGAPIQSNAGASILGIGGVATPKILGRRVVGVAGGREILLYLIMHKEVCSKVVTFEEK